MTRDLSHRYRDPLDQVWIAAAARMGFSVARSDESYAHVAGGQIFIGEAAFLDDDDCLAQMIVHELCHALVEGERGHREPDWGLDNTSDRDLCREHACLRVQAYLLGLYGLRRMLAPTTEHRAFYDALPEDPLAPRAGTDAEAAILGCGRAEALPFAPHLHDALAATADIAAVAARFKDDPAMLYATVDARPPSHPSGRGVVPPWHAGARCGDCAWAFVGGRGQAVMRCRAHGGHRIDGDWPGCERFEASAGSPPLDCQDCAACCRAGYDSVTVSRRDPVVRRQPALVVDRGRYLEIARTGDHCAALSGGGPFACTIYEDRPRPCRELAPGSDHCRTARRRVGKSV